jgi:hypothetical protein
MVPSGIKIGKEQWTILAYENYIVLTLSLLTLYIYIYGRDFYWGFCFLNHAFPEYMCEKPTNTPIILSGY